MSKNQLTKIIKTIFRPLPLGILTLVIGLVCALALRSNNSYMGQLRSQVYAADKNNGNVVLALQKLQNYVTHHMNTNLSAGNGAVYPPIQLKYTYQRLLNQESISLSNSNSQIYTDAQTYCQKLIPNAFSGRTRVPCIEQYIETHDSNLPAVPTALYEFDFISPFWSPDLAGYSLIATILSALAFLIAISLSLIKKFNL